MKVKFSPFLTAILFSVFFLFFGIFTNTSRAQNVDEIKKNIETKNAQIESLNKEIKQLDTQIQAVSKEGKNLEGAIKTLDISGNKLSKELTVTQSKISSAALTLQELEIEIGKSEKNIKKNTDAIVSSIKMLQQGDDVSMIESVLTYKNLGIIWNDFESIQKFQGAIKESIDRLAELKVELEGRHTETEKTKQTLVKLTNELSDQKKIIDINKQEKGELLSETKSKEQNYRKILDEKKRLSDAFTQELASYENQLRLAVDPNSYPTSGKGVLAWPLDNVLVTQYFGNTEFAKTAAYSGKGHNGIDLRATIGTRVKAAQSGVVQGTGNTSAVPGCYSYGKWVLLRHDNGLSTLYAHLSLIKVNNGERVNLGDVIGYSGNTGYATGPHLHFGVYATQGIRVVTFSKGQSINCTGAVMPVADVKAYLNPLVYLP